MSCDDRADDSDIQRVRHIEKNWKQDCLEKFNNKKKDPKENLRYKVEKSKKRV